MGNKLGGLADMPME